MPLNKPGRSGGILPYLFLYIPVVWAALLIAQSLGNGLPELLTNLTAALQTPLKIRWTEHSLMSILACTGAYIIGICLYCTTQGRTRDGEEHGSAQWASPKQVNAMFCQKQNSPPRPAGSGPGEDRGGSCADSQRVTDTQFPSRAVPLSGRRRCGTG